MRSARRPGSGGLIRTLRQLITLPRWFHPFERSSRFIPSPTLFVEIRLSMCGFRSGAGNDRTRLRRKGRPCHVTFLTVPTSRAGGTECFQRRGPETEPVTRAHQEPASIRRPSTTSRTPPPHMGGVCISLIRRPLRIARKSDSGSGSVPSDISSYATLLPGVHNGSSDAESEESPHLILDLFALFPLQIDRLFVRTSNQPPDAKAN